MTEEEARRVQQALELTGLPGEAGPVDPTAPEGPWCIWDQTDAGVRRDITLAALDKLIEKLGGTPHQPEPGWHEGRPVRGFIFPDHGRG